VPVYLSVITGWQPFDSNTILGTLDTVFLSCYSFGLVVVGGMFAQLLLIVCSSNILQLIWFVATGLALKFGPKVGNATTST
jgi:hypothetical protein